MTPPPPDLTHTDSAQRRHELMTEVAQDYRARDSSSKGMLCSAQSCPTLCDPMDYSPPGYCVHGVFQAILEWVAMASSRSSRPGTELMSSALAGRFFNTAPPGKPLKNIAVKLSQQFYSNFIIMLIITTWTKSFFFKVEKNNSILWN